MASLFNLIPTPYKSKVITKSDFLSEPWSKFFVKLFERVRILQTEILIFDVSRNEGTNLTTGTAKYTIILPAAYKLSNVRASVYTAPVGSTIIVDINDNGVSILSTKLSIDAGEKTSKTAATAHVISDVDISEGSEVTIDIDQIGSLTAGTGLKVFLYGVRV